ncbi:MAG: tetratricopeptide repeat protein [Acidimicrobiia bacterium]|nr:tetratricopeptide repeat protein [Acidimicrobiia bacterium]
MADRLRALWDFGDLTATEQHLRDQLDLESSDDGRAEVLSQLARIEGLRDDFERGEALIVEAEASGSSGAARSRIDLERGRLLRSGGRPEAALPLFESAFAAAVDAGQYFIAVDAAHMAALAAPDHDGFMAWTQRGVELADSHAEAHYWLGPLLNNLGWQLFDTGDLDAALGAFERALDVRLAEPDNRLEIEVARYAVGKTLRALGRASEAIPILETAVAWAVDSGAPDGWFHEELAEEYAAVGRDIEAGQQARLALPLLTDVDLFFRGDAERVARLSTLADGTATPG